MKVYSQKKYWISGTFSVAIFVFSAFIHAKDIRYMGLKIPDQSNKVMTVSGLVVTFPPV